MVGGSWAGQVNFYSVYGVACSLSVVVDVLSALLRHICLFLEGGRKKHVASLSIYSRCDTTSCLD